MIKHTTISDTGLEREHIIYEKHDVIPDSVRVFDWTDMKLAFRGDHVRDYHGRVVPVLYRQTLHRKRQGGKKDLMMVFPGQTYMASKHGDRPWVWSTAPKKRTLMTRKHTLFAKLLAEGVPEDQAYRTVWPSIPKTKIPSRVLQLFKNDKFVHLMIRETGMSKNTKDLFEKKGITVEEMVKRMVELMDDKKAPANLRKMAYDRAWEALTEEAKKLPQKSGGINIEQFNQMNLTQGDQTHSQRDPGGMSLSDSDELDARDGMDFEDLREEGEEEGEE